VPRKFPVTVQKKGQKNFERRPLQLAKSCRSLPLDRKARGKRDSPEGAEALLKGLQALKERPLYLRRRRCRSGKKQLEKKNFAFVAVRFGTFRKGGI